MQQTEELEKEKNREYCRTWRKKNADKLKKYQKKNLRNSKEMVNISRKWAGCPVLVGGATGRNQSYPCFTPQQHQPNNT